MTFGDPFASDDIDAKMLEIFLRFDREFFGIDGEDMGRSFDEIDLRFGRVDAAEIFQHGLVGDFGDGACHFNAGGAAADDDEVEIFFRLGNAVASLRFFKRDEDPFADF